MLLLLFDAINFNFIYWFFATARLIRNVENLKEFAIHTSLNHLNF